MARRASPSPILTMAAGLIGEASGTLVPRGSAFRHSFEAQTARTEPDPEQPRRHFDAAGIAALAATMREQGQLQPILLRRHPEGGGRWIIVAGERRWRAARSLGWPSLLAIEHDGDPEVVALLENLQRVDLRPQEEAAALHRLLDAKGWSQAQAAGALGRSKAEISATLRILSLPAALLEVLTSEHPVARNVLVELARVEQGPGRDRLAALARTGRLTVRAIRAEGERTAARATAQNTGAIQHAPAQPRVTPPPGPAVPQAPLDTDQLQALSGQLQLRRLSGPRPQAAERARLEQLRREIDALLGVWPAPNSDPPGSEAGLCPVPSKA